MDPRGLPIARTAANRGFRIDDPVDRDIVLTHLNVERHDLERMRGRHDRLEEGAVMLVESP